MGKTAQSEAASNYRLAVVFAPLLPKPLMLTAEVKRFVYRMAEGEWAITEHGRRTLDRLDRATPSHTHSK